MTDSQVMKPLGRRLTVTVAVLAIASAGAGAALAVISRPAKAGSDPCHGVRVATSKLFVWWMYPGEKFSRAWVCSHFGVPRVVVRSRERMLWRYGPSGPRGVTFVREPDGRFSPG